MDEEGNRSVRTRAEAQLRSDRIQAFREELRTLEREGGLDLTAAQRGSIERHHETVLAGLALRFEIDRTEEQRKLSLGMRIVSALGAITLAAAGYYFVYSFWGDLGPWQQAAALVGAPLLALGGTELAARRERVYYFTALLAIAAASLFVLNLALLAATFNLAVPPVALLAWALFCGLLGYAYGLRLLLVAGLLFLVGFVATFSGQTEICVWHAFGHRPENALPLGIAFYLVPFLSPRRHPPSFPAAYRTMGLLSLFVPLLLLASNGHASYLSIAPGTIAAGYQVLGFVVAALAIGLGIRRGLGETLSISSAFFVILVYLKFYEWWWESMPRWLFFLLLAAVAIVVLVVLRRLHRRAPRTAS